MMDKGKLPEKLRTALSQIEQQLPGRLRSVNARNYQDGSVAVIRSKKVLGLCFDNMPVRVIQNLSIDPCQFPDLKDLVIRSTPLQSIPDWVKQFTQIENLVLKSLDLDNIGSLLDHFPNLKFIALPDNNLSKIPPINNESMLYRINLNRNYFTSIPQSIQNLPNLVSLMMDHNYITETSEHIESVSLQALSLENNQLSEVPLFLREQPFLYNLDLSSNFIQSIPEWFGQFSKLQYLNLSKNRLTSIPNSLTNLSNLRLFELQHNTELDFSPSIIYGLEKLQIVNLEFSNLDQAVIDKLSAYQKMFDTNVLIKT